MDIRIINEIDPYLSTLSGYFRTFYEKEPWGDYKGCDHCYGELSLKEAPRFSSNEVSCTKCQRILGPFWSESRCKSSLTETNLFVAHLQDNALKGWIIGKPVTDSLLAIDYMGLDPKLRRVKPKIILMKEAICVVTYFLIKKWVKPLSAWANKRILNSPIPSLQLYCFFEDQAINMGYKAIQTTTHKDAKNIFNALRSVGFHLTQTDLPNNRVLFVKKIG